MTHPLTPPVTNYRWWDPAAGREAWRTSGQVRIPGFLHPSYADQLALHVQANVRQRKLSRVDMHTDANPIQRAAPYRAWLAGGRETATLFPVLHALAHPIRLLAEAVCGRPVIASPYPASAVTVIAYEPGDTQNPHLDTNPVAAVLYLAGQGTQFHDGEHHDGEHHDRPNPGSLAIFAGRNIWHGVPPVDEWKVTVVYNLYYPEDMWRPESQDERVYGTPDPQASLRVGPATVH